MITLDKLSCIQRWIEFDQVLSWCVHVVSCKHIREDTPIYSCAPLHFHSESHNSLLFMLSRKMSFPVRNALCGHIGQFRNTLTPLNARPRLVAQRRMTMAQQASPQEHPHTDPRTNEPSEQTPFSTKEEVNQQEFPGKVDPHLLILIVIASDQTCRPIGLP